MRPENSKLIREMRVKFYFLCDGAYLVQTEANASQNRFSKTLGSLTRRGWSPASPFGP